MRAITLASPTRRVRSPGFTLIELLIVVALIAIMLALAAPSFVKTIRNSQLTSTANSFVAAVTAARAESTKRNRSAYVVPTTGNDWSTGWVVFVDMNNSGTTPDAADLVILKETALPTTVTFPASPTNQFIDGGVAYIRFDGSGFPRQSSLTANNAFLAGSLDFQSNSELRRVIVSPSGRVRVCNPTTAPTGTCTQTAM